MEDPRNNNPRRRKKTKTELFKEAYLPVIIGGVALLLILIFIIGSIVRSVQKHKAEEQASIAASIAQQEQDEQLAAEARGLLAQAALLADFCDYDGAIATLEQFTGNMADFPELSAAVDQYVTAKSQLVAWEDPSQVVNLSFQLLIADPSRAFSHEVYGSSFNRNFITCQEFEKILEQLYNNGYILVDREDLFAQETVSGTTTYTAKTLYLPAGKKPLMLTQTNVNYNIYLVDGDGDRLPDKNGGGFASRMLVDENGNITNEIVNADGSTSINNSADMVPILNRFIQSHPDFSYCGARATIALTGYNGLFGYRTNASARQESGEDIYNSNVENIRAVAQKLRATGYELAFYTYENIAYGQADYAQVQADLEKWNEEVVPILGKMDAIVYAQLNDLTEEATYSGEKYQLLQNDGFRYYLGFCDDGKPWATVTNDYVRQGRIMVTGATLAHHADWFTGMFDAASVLDSSRGEVPAW